MEQPETCGVCERFFEGFCIPVKEKYGLEYVNADQKPSENCPYKYGKCECGAPIAKGYCTDEDCKQA
jgi:hypothetical protein